MLNFFLKDIPLHLHMIEIVMVVKILLFIRKDILPDMLSTTSMNNFKGLFVALNFRKKKFLLCRSYNLHKSNVSSHLISLGQTLDIQITKYDNFLIVGDFNSEFSESTTDTFCEKHHLHNLVKRAT